jgi:hypothetical protein
MSVEGPEHFTGGCLRGSVRIVAQFSPVYWGRPRRPLGLPMACSTS